MPEDSPHPGLWTPPASDPGCPLGRISLGAVASRVQPSETPAGWRRFGSYALALIVEGRGRYEDQLGHACELQPGSLITLGPTLGHRYGPDADGWIETYLVFDGPVFDLWHQHRLLAPRGPVQQLTPLDRWHERLAWVLHGHPAAAADPPADPLLQVTRLQTLLAELSAHAHRRLSDSADAPPAWLGHARELLTRDAPAPLDLQTVADQLHVSYSTFRRRFAQHVGMPPARFRAAHQIDHARQLMTQTPLSDKEIAYRLGFQDAQHFSKRFKHFVGRTPTQFRQSLR
ncbi:MAG: AraC family transcriptional regulator [Planctomycetota bacterium]